MNPVSELEVLVVFLIVECWVFFEHAPRSSMLPIRSFDRALRSFVAREREKWDREFFSDVLGGPVAILGVIGSFEFWIKREAAWLG